MGKRRDNNVTSWVVFIAIAVILAAVAVFTLGGRKNQLPHIDTIQSDSTISVGLTDSPTSLDIRTNPQNSVEQALLHNVYETLTGRDNKNDVVPGLANRWEISPDAKTYTFHLSKGITFADGHKLTASDVVWSLQQILTHKYHEYERLGDVQEVTNPDATTVVITLRSPNPTLLYALSARAGIVYNRNAKSTDYAHQAYGSGPFTVSSFSDNTIVMERNANYWSSKAKSSQVKLVYYDNENDLQNDLDNNVINMALPMSAASIRNAEANPTFHVSAGISRQKKMLALNNAGDSPFSDEQLRKAVRYAVNAAEIAKTQPDSFAQLSGPIGQLEPGYQDLNNLFPHNPDEARRMLAYFPVGYTGQIDMLAPQDDQELAQLLADQLNEVGFNVRVTLLERTRVEQRVKEGNYTMALYTMQLPDDCAEFAHDSSTFHFVNGDAERAFQDARASLNQKEYSERMAKYGRIVSENAASAWLYTRKDFVVTKSRLEGYPTNMTSRWLPLANITR